ncbi:hypothetical protein POM88_034521 [Heracleum sosnowskyi]|uniref:Transposase-associated domain-containing protein n=1 Tax=Heracleum sosnowskyi TaxID=360622 RepID=A0AAD8HLD5_9APIA|nr:hypothetical protein POM88_034521 [Heracleum sosnowskyi]
MDRQIWMYNISRIEEDYIKGVQDFILCALRHQSKKEKENGYKDLISCPCHLCGKRRILGIDDVVDEEEYNQFDENPPFSTGLPNSYEDEMFDTNYTRNDHDEGILPTKERRLPADKTKVDHPYRSVSFTDLSMDENANSGSKKRTRGPTTCKKLKETTSNKAVDKTVELDAFGKPLGKWQDNFTSYVGAVFRQRVDINIESWKDVNQGLKDTIWQDIKFSGMFSCGMHLLVGMAAAATNGC